MNHRMSPDIKLRSATAVAARAGYLRRGQPSIAPLMALCHNSSAVKSG